MRSGRSLTLGLGLFLAGCADPPAQPDPQPFSVESSDVWSGASVTLRSAGFVDVDPSAVLLDDDSLAFTRVDDSTLHVPLPDSPGTHQLRVVSPLVLPTSVTVKLNGFLSAERSTVFMGRAIRGAQPTEVYSSGPTGLRRWNVSTGATVDYPDSMHVSTCARGVGLGPHPGELVLHSACNATWKVWRVEPTIDLLDSITQPVFGDRFIDQRAGLVVVPGSHQTFLIRCDTACVSNRIDNESPFDVVYSPAGDRAVVLAYSATDTGAPVLDVATGNVSYYVDRLESAEAAVWSDEGDTLYLAGGDSLQVGGPNFLMALRSADGHAFRTVTVPFRTCGLALDPIRPLLYAAGHVRGTGQPVLAVFDRATHEPVTLLGAEMYAWGFPCMVLPSPLERRIYVIESADGGFDSRIQAPIARFETPPY
jgi:hypothetical protein